nr:SDR family oxidoreductase [uncultured Dyadobacter sp.]
MNLSGNTVLITGGSSGIGLALAKRFLDLQNEVLITGRDKSRLELVRAGNPGIGIFAGDLTRQQSLDELVLFVKSNYPGLNILVNNAAVQYNYDFAGEESVREKIEYEVATNLTAPIKLTALLLSVLARNQSSAVINLGSGLHMAPKKSASVYCATKSAIHSFSKTLRYQLESTGTKVFEVIPALVDTPMTTGRGRSKISPEDLVNEFMRDLERNKFESHIGKAKLLRLLSYLAPGAADRLMRDGQ